MSKRTKVISGQVWMEDERFGHKAGDIFLVMEADYDNDKYVGVKIKVENIDNSFYKSQMKSATIADIEVIATWRMLSSRPIERGEG